LKLYGCLVSFSVGSAVIEAVKKIIRVEVLMRVERDEVEFFSQTARKLAHLKLTPLQAEVLRELMNGNRTIAELTLSIFGVDYKEDKSQTYNSRIRRATKSLENAGFVSRKKILGRNRPYGLTVHGAARITSILPDMADPALITRWDLSLFSAVLLTGVIVIITEHSLLFDFFPFFLGMTVIRAIQIMKRVL
jgi:hypothetical protein